MRDQRTGETQTCAECKRESPRTCDAKFCPLCLPFPWPGTCDTCLGLKYADHVCDPEMAKHARDLFLYECAGCGQRTILGPRGGTLNDCPCEDLDVLVTSYAVAGKFDRTPMSKLVP